MSTRSIPAIAALLIVFVAPAPAHHAFTPHYDPNNIVTFTGTVTEFQFRNPHSFLAVEVTDAAGETELWNCETHAAVLLRRQGLTRDLFTEGEEVTISGPAARREATGCRIYTVTRPDGSRVQLFDGSIPQTTVDAAAVNETLFGDWLPVIAAMTLRADRIANEQLGPNPFEAQLTAAGRAAHADYDQVTDDPTLFCNPASPWRAWAGSPGSPIRFERLDDRIEIRFEWMDAMREVRLDENTLPVNATPTPLGYSIGRLDADSLIVETTAMSTGILIPHPGVLMSPNANLTEQISLDDATGRARISWQLDDPAFYSSPLIGEFTLEATSVPFEPFDCVPVQD